MSRRAAPAGRPAGAAALRSRVLHAVRTTLFQRLPRLFFFAGLSVALGAVMLATKLGLFIAAPDWFLLANIVFTVGAIATKLYLLHRRASTRGGKDPASAQRTELRAYRRTGVIIVSLSALYLLTLSPALSGAHTSEGRDLWSGVSIAAVAFTELVLSLVAAVAGRRDVEPVASAIRRMSLANALILVALAQSALVAAIGPAGAQTSTVTSLGFGTAAAIVGGGMLIRSRREAPRPSAARRPGEPIPRLHGERPDTAKGGAHPPEPTPLSRLIERHDTDRLSDALHA